jgi:PAS domain S-box-containing protein
VKLHHKLLAAFSLLACLAGMVGLYSLHGTRQIIRSFEGGDDHFRTIITASTELASYTQRTKGHLFLYLTLHQPEDLRKYYARSEKMLDRLALLKKTVLVPEGKKLLDRIDANVEHFLGAGDVLIEDYRKDSARNKKFALGEHPELIKQFYASCLAVKEAALDLETLETDFLNKQLAITTSSEVSSLAKETEGWLMLYLTLRDPQYLASYREGCTTLDKAVSTLDHRVHAPSARALLTEINDGCQRFHQCGSTLLASYRNSPPGRSFVPEENADEIRAFHQEAAHLRSGGLSLSRLLTELENAKKAAVMKTANSIERSVLFLAVIGGALILILGYFLSVTIAKPIVKLKKAAEQLGCSAIQPIPELRGRGEIACLADSFQQMATELRETREELISSKEYTDNILRSVSDALFVVSPEGTLQTVNRATCRLLGYEEKEILGRPLQDIMGQKPLFLLDRHEKSPLLQGVEVILRGKQGKLISVSFSCTIMYDRAGDLEGVVCMAKDITEYKKAMEEIARLATVVEQAAEAIVITDHRGRIQYVNPAFEKITGYSRNEAIGASPRLLKSDEHDHQFYQSLWQTIAKGEIWSGHFINRKKDGTLYDEECIISPVRDHTGRIINYVSLKRDVTHEKGLERQLIQSQKHEALGTLAGGIAHDLNNILSPVMGYASLAKNRLSPEDRTYQYLEKIFQAGERASNLVNQILTFCRKKEPIREPLHMGTIVEEVLNFLRGTLPATIEIRQNLQKSAGLVLADSNQIHQVIMNLCTNAYQAIRDEGGVLEISLREQIGPPCSTSENRLFKRKHLRLAISDSGCGMDQETKARIFEPYFTTKEEGSGLGLATVRGIIESHEGIISVHSQPGKGTTFEIFLPLLLTPIASQEKKEDKKISLQANGDKCILFVDNERVVVELGTEVLRESGYQVVGQTNSQEALELFRSTPDRFDLLVTDQTMPGLTGTDLSRRVLAIRKDLPIILITGFSGMANEHRAYAHGISGLLMKPFKPDDLLRKIYELLYEGRKIRN